MQTLKNRSEFLQVKQKGRSKATPSVVVQYLATEGDLRVGYTATNQTFGNAVNRNRARRVLREAARAVMTENLKADIVLIGRKPVLDTPLEKIKEQIAGALTALQK